LELLQDVSQRLTSIESILGVTGTTTNSSPLLDPTATARNGNQSAPSLPRERLPGIDIVLGAQWGDEGKGKLVDILSQVKK
jgi:hypothetical protein